MNKRQKKKLSLGLGLAGGVLADISFRLICGNDGNLLVHGVIFLGCTLIVAAVAYGLFSIRH